MIANRTQSYLSPSRVKTFFECKFKYKCKYVDKVKPTNITPPHVFGPGNTVHDLGEHYCYAKMNQSEEEISTDINKFMKQYKLEDYFYDSIKEQYDFLRSYLNPFLVDEYEGRCKILKEVKVNNHWFNNYWFFGYIDFRAIYKDYIVITDYKSSKEEGDHELQLGIYAYNTAKSLKVNFEQIKSTVFYTKLNKIEDKIFNKEEIKEILRKVSHVLKLEATEKIWDKSPNQYCENCEYFNLCKPRT